MKPRLMLFVSKIALEAIYNSLRMWLEFIQVHQRRCYWESHKDVHGEKIGQLSSGKDIRIPVDSEDMVTFFKDKETEKTIKDYEYLLNEKQSTLNNYVQYLDTACELAKIKSRLLK